MMTNTQTIEVPDALKAKMAAEAKLDIPTAPSKREVTEAEWD